MKKPTNARWIIGNQHLPQNYGKAKFKIQKPDYREHVVTVSKRKRQTLECLMKGSVYCASPIRLSDNVLLLRRDDQVGIDTDFYEDTSGPIKTRYGVYSLSDTVTYLGEVA